jgi:hypothetical protein
MALIEMVHRLCVAVVVVGCGSNTREAPPPAASPLQTPAPPAAATAPPRALPARAAAHPLVRDPSAAVRCGKLDGKLAADATLIAGRMKLRVPAGAGSIARAYDVMSSPAPPEEEERLVLGGGQSVGKDPGDEAFVILGAETWQLDPDRATVEADAIVHPGTLDDEAPKFLHAVFAPDLDVEPVAVADPGMRVYAGRPKTVAAQPGADAALVLALLVALPDATLDTVAFYVTPSLASNAGCVGLAERIGASLATGPRPLDRAAGERSLGRVATGALSIRAPADYVVVHQPGPDFDTYKLFYLRALSLYPGTITISVDRYADGNAGADGSAREPGTLLGKPVEWRGTRTARGGVLIATRQLGDGVAVQVALQATRESKVLDEFRRVAETIAVKK